MVTYYNHLFSLLFIIYLVDAFKETMFCNIGKKIGGVAHKKISYTEFVLHEEVYEKIMN